MEIEIQLLEKEFTRKGVIWGSEILLLPKDALDFIIEVEKLNLDYGISGICLWELCPDNKFMEVLESFN